MGALLQRGRDGTPGLPLGSSRGRAATERYGRAFALSGPTPFGRYTLLMPLSVGGMGEIFLARLEGAQGFEKLCVIKKILPHLAEVDADLSWAAS